MSAAATSSPSAPRLPARIVAHPLFWPLATLALLLLGNGLWNPGFLA
ncbi:ABC transporter permease, partial [Xanthomonas translucens DAR61454]